MKNTTAPQNFITTGDISLTSAQKDGPHFNRAKTTHDTAVSGAYRLAQSIIDCGANPFYFAEVVDVKEAAKYRMKLARGASRIVFHQQRWMRRI